MPAKNTLTIWPVCWQVTTCPKYAQAVCILTVVQGVQANATTIDESTQHVRSHGTAKQLKAEQQDI